MSPFYELRYRADPEPRELRFTGHERVVVAVARAPGNLLAGFGVPVGRPDQTRLDEFQAADERAHLGPAAYEHRSGRRVVDPGRGVHLRSGVRRAVRERNVAARREWR